VVGISELARETGLSNEQIMAGDLFIGLPSQQESGDK
jgi:hypothetical protein